MRLPLYLVAPLSGAALVAGTLALSAGVLAQSANRQPSSIIIAQAGQPQAGQPPAGARGGRGGGSMQSPRTPNAPAAGAPQGGGGMRGMAPRNEGASAPRRGGGDGPRMGRNGPRGDMSGMPRRGDGDGPRMRRDGPRVSPGVTVERYGRNRGGNRPWRSGRAYNWGPGATFYFWNGYYYGDCGWLRRRAMDTGSRYWWSRYRMCRASY